MFLSIYDTNIICLRFPTNLNKSDSLIMHLEKYTTAATSHSFQPPNLLKVFKGVLEKVAEISLIYLKLET